MPGATETGLIVRPLAWELHELEQVIAIDSLCFNRFDAWALEDYARWHKRNPELCLVAETGGRIAGDVITRLLKGRAELASLAVHPDYRRLGVGAALLAETERRVAARGVAVIELQVRKSNTSGRRFWERSGFAPYGEARAFYGDGEDALLMRKRLQP